MWDCSKGSRYMCDARIHTAYGNSTGIFGLKEQRRSCSQRILFSLSCIDRNSHIHLATFLIKEKIQDQKCLLSWAGTLGVIYPQLRSPLCAYGAQTGKTPNSSNSAVSLNSSGSVMCEKRCLREAGALSMSMTTRQKKICLTMATHYFSREHGHHEQLSTTRLPSVFFLT